MYENENYSGLDTYNTENAGNDNNMNNTQTKDDGLHNSGMVNADRSMYSDSGYEDVTYRNEVEKSHASATDDYDYHSSVNGSYNYSENTSTENVYEKNVSAGNNYGTTAAYDEKKKKPGRAGAFFKKALLSISLGLFFGLFAGIGFYAVQEAVGVLYPEPEKTEEVTDVIASNPITEGMQLNNTSNVTVVQSNVVEVAEEVMPAMVSIINKYTVTSSFWGQTYSEEAASSGSGIIVGKTDTELLIVSNNHVVEGAETLEIPFIDGMVAEAHIKGLDSDMDLAVIAVALDSVSEETMSAITVATLGNSDDLQLGEPVIAIGNALGYGQSVTDGIVSALNREITMEDGSTGIFIQTNAAINPGNSGGALLNVNGEVIGINTSKIGGTAIEGMGYAIPITSANPIIADLMERQTRNKVAEGEMGYIGISLQEVTSQIAAMYNWPQGIYVLSVEEGSAAQAAGVMPGDIITKFDGERITSYEELQNILQYFAAGDSTDLTVMRPERGQYVEYTLDITLGERPAENR